MTTRSELAGVLSNYVGDGYEPDIANATDAVLERWLLVDPKVLADVLVYHQRKDAGHCLCGWGQLGWSHPEHVVERVRVAMSGPAGFEAVVGRFAARDPLYPG